MYRHETEIIDKLQAECIVFTNNLLKNAKTGNKQDATNFWMFKKLAKYEIRIKELEDYNNYDPPS